MADDLSLRTRFRDLDLPSSALLAIDNLINLLAMEESRFVAQAEDIRQALIRDRSDLVRIADEVTGKAQRRQDVRPHVASCPAWHDDGERVPTGTCSCGARTYDELLEEVQALALERNTLREQLSTLEALTARSAEEAGELAEGIRDLRTEMREAAGLIEVTTGRYGARLLVRASAVDAIRSDRSVAEILIGSRWIRTSHSLRELLEELEAR